MTPPKTIKVSETMIMPHGRNNVTHVYHSDTALKAWIEENSTYGIGAFDVMVKIVNVTELLKFLNE